MPRRLPPLNALRAFEAAARHCSFTRAAGELHVTQAAISHQVRQLEEWLGLKLFERSGHTLALTTEGKAYLPELTSALDNLAAATNRLAGNTLSGSLRITVLPSFASKWLMPRLGRFREACPDIDLQLTVSVELHDFADGGCDLGIRSGLGRWSGLHADLIAHESLSPVCSPSLAHGNVPLQTPSDLRRHVLLHDQPRDAWRRWLDMAGEISIDATAGPGFSDSAMVLQAAIEGHGVALGRLFLAAGDIAAGKLVRPFAQTLPNDFSYWLVCPKSSLQKARVATFRHWLLQEAASGPEMRL